MIRTSSLEVSIRTHIDCTLNISSMLPCLLSFVCILIAPSVNILCISTIVLMVAFVNLILKKMMMMMMMIQHWSSNIKKILQFLHVRLNSINSLLSRKIWWKIDWCMWYRNLYIHMATAVVHTCSYIIKLKSQACAVRRQMLLSRHYTK